MSKRGRPKKEESDKAKWNDKILCEICGEKYLRSNQTRHKKSKIHISHLEKTISTNHKISNSIKKLETNSSSEERIDTKIKNEFDKKKKKIEESEDKSEDTTDESESDEDSSQDTSEENTKSNELISITNYFLKKYGNFNLDQEMVKVINNHKLNFNQKLQLIEKNLNNNRIIRKSDILNSSQNLVNIIRNKYGNVAIDQRILNNPNLDDNEKLKRLEQQILFPGMIRY